MLQLVVCIGEKVEPVVVRFRLLSVIVRVRRSFGALSAGSGGPASPWKLQHGCSKNT